MLHVECYCIIYFANKFLLISLNVNYRPVRNNIKRWYNWLSNYCENGIIIKFHYPSSAKTSAVRNDNFNQLRRNIRLKRSRYSRDRIRKVSVEGSAKSAVKESPLVTRNVARNIWSLGESEVRNVSKIKTNNQY